MTIQDAVAKTISKQGYVVCREAYHPVTGNATIIVRRRRAISDPVYVQLRGDHLIVEHCRDPLDPYFKNKKPGLLYRDKPVTVRYSDPQLIPKTIKVLRRRMLKTAVINVFCAWAPIFIVVSVPVFIFVLLR